MRRLVVGVLLVTAVVAQVPAQPAGESAPAFTAAEAQAFALASRLAEAWRRGDGQAQLRDVREYGSYRLRVARAGERGQWELADDGNLAFGAAGGLCFVVPAHTGVVGRRLICVRSDGVLAWTDNEVGSGLEGGRELAADDVLGAGGRGILRDFPRTPQRGRDGNLWLPDDVVRRATLRLVVVDEVGEPMAGVEISTFGDGGDVAHDVPLPAGQVRTLLEGDAVLTGVPARGLALSLTIEGTTLQLPKTALALHGSAARITVPRALLQSARMNHNESAAIATLKNISSAQAQCQACGVIDANRNGAGEYGTFAELAGRDVVRGGTGPIAPPVLSTAFGRVENGVVTRSGYCFRLFLPAKDGSPVAELPNGGADANAIDAAAAETKWCVYAWPLEAGVTGQRAFFIDHRGDVLGSRNEDGRYSSAAKGPAASAAHAAGEPAKLGSRLAVNMLGLDGLMWLVIG